MFAELFEQRKSYPRFAIPSWMKSYSRINYEDIKDVPDEEIIAAFEAMKENDKVINQNRRHNMELANTARDRFIADLKASGINPFGVRGGLLSPYKPLIREIEKQITGGSYPAMPSPYFYYNNEEVRVYNGSLAERVVKFKKMIEQKIANELKADKLYRASIEYALNNDIDISEVEPQKVVSVVRDYAEMKFVAENYPDGTEMEAAGCDYCDTWIVGERRCSCGNRRQYLEVDGNILDGFYAYPQPY